MEMDECGETLLNALIDADYFGREPFECTHPEHWAAVVDDGTGWLDWDDPPAECRWLQAHNDCLLPVGHSDDHAFDWPSPGLVVVLDLASKYGTCPKHHVADWREITDNNGTWGVCNRCWPVEPAQAAQPEGEP